MSASKADHDGRSGMKPNTLGLPRLAMRQALLRIIEDPKSKVNDVLKANEQLMKIARDRAGEKPKPNKAKRLTYSERGYNPLKRLATLAERQTEMKERWDERIKRDPESFQ